MAADFLSRARAFWSARNRRERLFLAIGAGALGVALLYGLAYDPLARAREKLASRLPQTRAEVRLMRVQVAEIERLRGSLPAADRGSLARTVDAGAAAQGLREALVSVDPLGQGRVRVATRAQPAAAWLAWLDELERQGVRVLSCRLSLDDKTREASLEAVLDGGAR